MEPALPDAKPGATGICESGPMQRPSACDEARIRAGSGCEPAAGGRHRPLRHVRRPAAPDTGCGPWKASF